MKDIGFFAIGLAAGVGLGIAMAFFALGSTIRIKIDLPSDYKIEGIPTDFTIRGGLNLSPESGVSSPSIPLIPRRP